MNKVQFYIKTQDKYLIFFFFKNKLIISKFIWPLLGKFEKAVLKWSNTSYEIIFFFCHLKSDAMNKISVKFWCRLASWNYIYARTCTMFLLPIIYVSRRKNTQSAKKKMENRNSRWWFFFVYIANFILIRIFFFSFLYCNEFYSTVSGERTVC